MAQLSLGGRARTASLEDMLLNSTLSSPDTRLSLDVNGMTCQAKWYGGMGGFIKSRSNELVISCSAAAYRVHAASSDTALFLTLSPLIASSPLQCLPHGGASPDQNSSCAVYVCLQHSVSCLPLVPLGVLCLPTLRHTPIFILTPDSTMLPCMGTLSSALKLLQNHLDGRDL